MIYQKKYLLIFILLSLLKIGHTQSLWFQEETTWVHRVGAGEAGGFVETKLEKDTIIDGITCKKFVRNYELFDASSWESINKSTLPPLFMYATADDAEVYFYENGIFKKIYDFNAVVGDLVTLPYLPIDGIETICPNNEFVIDSVGTATINGVDLKWFSVAPTSESQYFYYGRIYQKIGPTALYFYVFASSGFCQNVTVDFNFIDEFRCFSDNAFDFKNSGVIDNWAGNCYFPGEKPITTNIVTTHLSPEIVVYPNPVDNQINIQVDWHSKEAVELVDLTGRAVLTLNLDKGDNIVDCASLNPGLYFLKFKAVNKIVKIVKK